MSSLADFFNSHVPDLIRALTAQSPDSGMSPISQIQNSLSGISAAASGQPEVQQQWNAQNAAVQQAAKNNLLQRQQLQLQQQNAAGEAALRNAQIGNLNSETAARNNPPLKPKEEQWTPLEGYTAPDGTPLEIERNSGQTRPMAIPGGVKQAAPKNPSLQPLSDGQISQGNAMSKTRYQVLHPGQDLPDAYTLKPGATNEDWTRITSGLAGEESAYGQQSQRNLQQQDFNQRRQDAADARADKLAEPTAKEKDRADLAKNANENLDALENIVRSRPDLFGATGGRITQLKQFIGTDDPAIGTLKNISDNLGMVQQSAHGMRSAQHVEEAANSILNSYKNGPQAVLAAIANARKSVGTFLADVGETPNSHPRAGSNAPPAPASNLGAPATAPSTGGDFFSQFGGRARQQ